MARAICPLLLALSLAAPAGAAEGERVLVLDLEALDASKNQARTLTGLLATEVTSLDVGEVLTGQDVQRTVELESMRQALDCNGDSSCLAEVAGALGATRVLYGDVGKLGATLVINLNLLDAVDVRSLGRSTVRADRIEDVPDKLRPALAKLFAGVSASDATAPDAGAPAPSESDAPAPSESDAPAPGDVDNAPAPDVPAAAPESGGFSLTEGGGAALVAAGIGAATGALFIVGGLVPLALHEGVKGQIAGLEGDGLGSLDEARELQKSQSAHAAAWAGAGQPALFVGAATVTVALALAAGGGLALALSPGGEE